MVPTPLTVRAPAKVNLHLGVGDVRPDGFHELAMLMQSLDLTDELLLAPSADGHTTIGPTGPRPLASVLNFDAGGVVANRDLVAVDGAGAARAWSVPPAIHYVVDVNNWYGPGG